MIESGLNVMASFLEGGLGPVACLRAAAHGGPDDVAGSHRVCTKHIMFEQSVAVPLIISMPDRMQSRAARRELAEHVDLFPTLAQLCGHAVPEGVPGRSFAALVKNRRYVQREFAYSEYYFCHRVFTRDDRYVGRPPILMVRTDKWKLSWGRSELFDLHRDRGEFRNCIDDSGNAGVVKELSAIARRMFAA